MKLILTALGLTMLCGCTFVGTSDCGVVTESYGRVTGQVVDPGMHGYNPFGGGIHDVNVGTKKHDVEAAAASHDLQHVDAKIATNYHVDAGEGSCSVDRTAKSISTLYKKMPNLDYESKIIDPTVQDSLKAATAQYPAVQLIDKREEVRQKIEKDLQARLALYGIKVDQVNMTNFEFTKEFNDAVERKVVAQQDQATATTEKQTAKIKAEGQRDAQNAQKQSLTPALLQKEALDKWDGHLPQYMNGPLPFLTVKQ